jgi:hypothetical protein|tara:strand:+ start:2679 stop:3494 length:816 start_codon:yes stop_codon:yes gene_type:complete
MEKLVRRHWDITTDGSRRYYEREYLIYTKDEADNKGIHYKSWKRCRGGDWGLSTDGYVAECIKRREYKSKRGVYPKGVSFNLVFPYGQAFYSERYPERGSLEYRKHEQTGTYTSVSSRPTWELERDRTRTKNFVRAYVKQYLGGKLNYSVLGRIYRSDEDNPVVRAKSLLKKKYVKDMIDKELSEILTSKGIDEGTVFDMLIEAADMARQKEQASNLLRVAENLMDIFGMKAKKEVTQEFEADVTFLEGIEEKMRLEGARIEETKQIEPKN